LPTRIRSLIAVLILNFKVREPGGQCVLPRHPLA
jgi:hypothetical protein